LYERRPYNERACTPAVLSPYTPTLRVIPSAPPLRNCRAADKLQTTPVWDVNILASHSMMLGKLQQWNQKYDSQLQLQPQVLEQHFCIHQTATASC